MFFFTFTDTLVFVTVTYSPGCEYIINDSLRVHAHYSRTPVTHTEAVVVYVQQCYAWYGPVYLLRRLPASWPLSLDQSVPLLPCSIKLFLLLYLQKGEKTSRIVGVDKSQLKYDHNKGAFYNNI